MDKKNNIALKVENLSKIYRLGEYGSGSISQDLNSWWAKVRGKEDPNKLITDSNDRTQKTDADFVYALKNLNFEIAKGEVVGVIGKNGAGKSTLLKVLSKITGPSEGVVKINGRIASLLEVGTGMHLEMTAKENIYLNGAILGMKKAEIRQKFNEIVDFAGCQKYIDTPVKRFSSGMRVRLGFAVAAFLEPEILIVDEVLAVGDAEFQKRAIGKMKEVSEGQGRTVLFVSHNMASVRSLCPRSILLENGEISEIGETDKVIHNYLFGNRGDSSLDKKFEEVTKPFYVSRMRMYSAESQNKTVDVFQTNESIFLELDYMFKISVRKCHFTLSIKNSRGEVVCFFDRSDYYKQFFNAEAGEYKTKIEIPNPLLKEGEYFISAGVIDLDSGVNDHKHEVIKFSIENNESLRKTREGNIYLPVKWELKKKD